MYQDEVIPNISVEHLSCYKIIIMIPNISIAPLSSCKIVIPNISIAPYPNTLAQKHCTIQHKIYLTSQLKTNKKNAGGEGGRGSF